MTEEQFESPNVRLVETILKSLAESRVSRGGWYDSEEEVTAVESLAFKIGESIKPFLLARMHDPEYFASIPLNKDVLDADIIKVLNSVKKKGFYPSPYSQIPDVDDQYTDFAAFCLEFSDLVYEYAEQSHLIKLSRLAQSVAKQSLSFLIDQKNYFSDIKGCRWAGTSAYLREKKVKEYYTDVYFTSVVIIAFRKVLERPVLTLNEREKDKLRGLIRNGGRWIVGRATDDNLLTGDERKSVKKLIYTTWGLRALVETNDTQEEMVRSQINPIITAYLREIDGKLDRDSVSLGQEYLTILSPTVNEPLYYEDRSDWGGILLTLISLRQLPAVDALLETTNYKILLDTVYNGLLVLRNPNSKLWYKDKFILSIHSYLIEAFLSYEKFSKDFGVEIGITSVMLRQAIKEALLDESLISALQHSVYSRLSGLSKKRKEDIGFSNAVAQVVSGVPSKKTLEELPQQKKMRSKKQ
jgi:hypothetical protein